jgi:hypothetical protein
MPDDGTRDYAVGYGRPPRHTQFHKGRSGNPKGRPKGMPDVAAALRQALLERVTVKEGSVTKRLRKLDVAVRQQVNKAAAGNARAFNLLMQLFRDAANGGNVQQPIQIVISEADSRL